MNIKEFLKANKGATSSTLAATAGTKLVYLRQISNGHRRASADLAIRIEHASGGQITAREIRPDLPWPAISQEQNRDDRNESNPR